MVERNRELPAQLLKTDPGLAALFSSYFAAFMVQASNLKAAIGAGRLRTAREIIERDLHVSALSAGVIAVKLGISVRQLQLLFEPNEPVAPATYSRAGWSGRGCCSPNPEAARLRKSPRRESDSLATFHRNFRTAYGMSPGDYRQSVKRAGANSGRNRLDRRI